MAGYSSPYLVDEQRWMRVLSPRAADARPALFLDRDGVMIEEREYLSDPRGVTLIHGCSALIRKAHEQGLAVVVVTNQSGIGRGYFGWSEYDQVERRMLDLLASESATVDAILANAAAPVQSGMLPGSGEDWRKPRPGMFIAAAHVLNINLRHSAVIGDKASDLEAGRAAGLPAGVHVLTGHGIAEQSVARALATASFEIATSQSVADLRVLLDRGGACSLDAELRA